MLNSKKGITIKAGSVVNVDNEILVKVSKYQYILSDKLQGRVPWMKTKSSYENGKQDIHFYFKLIFSN